MDLSSGTATLETIVKDTLVVDIYEGDKKLLLWRETGNDTLHADPEKLRTQIRESIMEMFAKFPPPDK